MRITSSTVAWLWIMAWPVPVISEAISQIACTPSRTPVSA
jgi:hypothetical protein